MQAKLFKSLSQYTFSRRKELMLLALVRLKMINRAKRSVIFKAHSNGSGNIIGSFGIRRKYVAGIFINPVKGFIESPCYCLRTIYLYFIIILRPAKKWRRTFKYYPTKGNWHQGFSNHK